MQTDIMTYGILRGSVVADRLRAAVAKATQDNLRVKASFGSYSAVMKLSIEAAQKQALLGDVANQYNASLSAAEVEWRRLVNIFNDLKAIKKRYNDANDDYKKLPLGNAAAETEALGHLLDDAYQAKLILACYDAETLTAMHEEIIKDATTAVRISDWFRS
jgi:hypothetical protein